MLQKQRLLTPGPTPIPERVRLVMAQEMIHHRKPVFKDAMARIQQPLQDLFGVSGSPVLTMACSGTGVMTAAMHCLFKPQEKVLIVEAGKFAERWREIATVRGLQTTSLMVPFGEAVNPADVAAALDADSSICGVFIQLSETSTGVQHPVEAVARITRQRDVLLVVDGISAVGISPCSLDDWGMDCLLTGSQKGLMVPTGLGLMALSDRAWKKAEDVAPSCFYFNVLKERSNVEKNQTLFSSPVSHILGLAESLDMFAEFGLKNVYRKQWALTMMARQGIAALGLELFVPQHFTWGLTALCMPAGVDAGKVLQICADGYGVIMAGGQDAMKGKIIRMGHMGWLDWADIAAGLHALAKSLAQVGGYSASRDYLEQALAAYHAALDVLPGSPIPIVRS